METGEERERDEHFPVGRDISDILALPPPPTPGPEELSARSREDSFARLAALPNSEEWDTGLGPGQRGHPTQDFNSQHLPGQNSYHQ